MCSSYIRSILKQSKRNIQMNWREQKYDGCVELVQNTECAYDDKNSGWIRFMKTIKEYQRERIQDTMVAPKYTKSIPKRQSFHNEIPYLSNQEQCYYVSLWMGENTSAWSHIQRLYCQCHENHPFLKQFVHMVMQLNLFRLFGFTNI